MNHGPLIFLGVLVTFVASWWGLIFSPQLQIGSQQSTEVDGALYPSRRAGVALQGREVYVANGCVHCHGQQVRQEGYTFDVKLASVGTNAAKVAAVLSRLAPGVKADDVIAKVSETSPQTILVNVTQDVADDAQKAFKAVGAVANPVFIPVGADITRGSGVRRSVGADYLYDYPVQIGNSRLGPDLANYGNRAPVADLILAHLYDPRITMPGSLMSAYRYLFEIRPMGKQPSPNALKLTGKFAAPAGHEVVPKTEALQLVEYLRSLHQNTALLEGPLPQLAPPPAVAGTNAAATNAAPATAPKP